MVSGVRLDMVSARGFSICGTCMSVVWTEARGLTEAVWTEGALSDITRRVAW